MSEKKTSPKADKPFLPEKPKVIPSMLQGRKTVSAEFESTVDSPLMIYEQVEAAKKLAKKTGQRIRRRFNRKEFVTQYPAAGSDPRMAFTPENFVLDISPMATLTVGELRDMCLKIKEHPLALQKALQVEGLADGTVIHILKEEYVVLTNAAK